MTEQPQKRTRRTKAQMEADNATARTNDRGGREGRSSRADIRQKTQKPLKLDVTLIKDKLEQEHGKKLQLKWVRHTTVNHHQEIGWEVVSGNMKTQVNKYTPDGRLKTKGEDIQDQEGGAYTADVGNGEFNFLMYKDLEAYLAEDAVWDKEEADRPMDSLQEHSEMGARAGLGGEVSTYQPNQQVKINKQRSEY